MTPREQFIHDLSAILVKKGSLTEKNALEIQQAFEESPSDSFDAFLLDEGFVDREDLLAALSTYYNVPSFEAQGYFFDEILIRDFPKDVLLRHAVIPLKGYSFWSQPIHKSLISPLCLVIIPTQKWSFLLGCENRFVMRLKSFMISR